MLYKDIVKVWSDLKITDMLDRFFLKFTYSNNKIDNHETRLRDVESIFHNKDITDFTGYKITLQEIKNYKILCISLLQCNTKISISLLKKFHYTLIKDCLSEELLFKGARPGEFRKDDNMIKKLKLLIEEVNAIKINEINALEVISYFHCTFIKINPFITGTGAVARILINYLLINNNLAPIIIFYTDLEEYNSALEYFNTKQDITKVVDFLNNQAYKTWIKDYTKLKTLKDFLS